MTLAKLIRLTRQARGVTLRALEAQTGLSNAMISQLETGWVDDVSLRNAAKLAKAQRSLSKKKLGSANRRKAKINVARVHAKLTDCRKDFLHKQSSKLVNENQVICVETLRIKNMIKNHCLSKSIADASWGELTRQLEYKSNWTGRTFVAIDQWFPSSKRCNCCGHIVDKMPLDIRSWTCPKCLTTLDRDINAANNIKRQGMSLIAFGENVSGIGLVPVSSSR